MRQLRGLLALRPSPDPVALARITSYNVCYTKLLRKEWQPEVKLDMDTKTAVLAENIYEVALTLTVTCTLGEETAFLCEVKQAGIFTVANLEGPQLAHCLGAYCPTILFPYARETISSLVSRGSFPQLNLAPVRNNFV